MSGDRLRHFIIGYGNPLRGDDAVGWILANQLLSRYADRADIRVMALHQLSPDLAEPLAQAQHVLFIDASAELPAGQLQWRDIQPPHLAGPINTHHLLPETLLALAQSLYGHTPQAKELSIGAQNFAHSMELSIEAQSALDSAMELIEALLLLKIE